MAVNPINSVQTQTTQTTQTAAVRKVSQAVKSTTSTSAGMQHSMPLSKSDKGDVPDKAQQDKLKTAVDKANTQLKHTNTRCEFKYYEKTNRVAIKIIDQDTDEIIKEIPPEETLEMVEKMLELTGILVDERR